MMLHHSFTGIKTKRIVFEDVFVALDSTSLEQLKDLTAKRRLIEESVNDNGLVTEATAREMSGGLTSRNQQEILKMEQYLPLLKNLITQTGSGSANGWNNSWVSDLKIRWTSIVGSSSTLKLNGPKYFQIDSLKYELGMTLFLYGLTLRERAFEVLEELPQSASLLKQAAGIFNHLNTEILPSLQPILPREKPPEVVNNVSSAMSLLCLAEAQAVSIKMAEKKNMSASLLAKLHYGVTQLLDEASAFLPPKSRNISERFLEFISSCRNLHELRSHRHLAESYKEAKQFGIAIGLLKRAKNKKNVHGNQSSRKVFRKEVDVISEMLTKYQKENSFVYNDPIPRDFELPALEGKKMVTATLYKPEKWEQQIVFKPCT